MEGRKEKERLLVYRKEVGKGRKFVSIEGINEGNKNGLLLCWNDEKKWKEMIGTGRRKKHSRRKERKIVSMEGRKKEKKWIVGMLKGG